MKKYDSYFLMNLNDAKEYALEKVTRFDWDENSMQCKEIGDGNLNYVFRVWDGKGHSAIIKQAGRRGAAHIGRQAHFYRPKPH